MNNATVSRYGDLMNQLSSPQLRPATPNDTEALAALKLRTFRETFIEDFAIPYPPDDLAIFETASYAPEAVARELADPAKRAWVVTQNDEMLGYLNVGPSKLPHTDVTPTSGEIYQIYVLRAAQGLGIGKLLLDTALTELPKLYPGPIWLGVWSQNLRAQAVYHKRGFTKVGDYQFPVGAWRDDEFIFRRD